MVKIIKINDYTFKIKYGFSKNVILEIDILKIVYNWKKNKHFQ